MREHITHGGAELLDEVGGSYEIAAVALQEDLFADLCKLNRQGCWIRSSSHPLNSVK